MSYVRHQGDVGARVPLRVWIAIHAYCVPSFDEELNDVLSREWPHDILASLP